MRSMVDSSRTTRIPTIRMGEMAVANGEGALRTLLGSCVGLALYDRRRRVAGLAHIVLPDSRGNDQKPGKFVDTAIPGLVKDMEELAGTKLKLSARLAGGANMFATNVVRTIGEQNIEACEGLLRAMRIPIVGRHCGGEKGRNVLLDAATGVMTISVVGSEPVEI